MTSALLITTAGQNAILADAAGGAELVITHVAFGDANGVPYQPNVNQVGLVNERYRAPILASVATNGVLSIDASIPATGNDALGRPAYGFTVHEAGVWGTSGGAAVLIGVAQMSGGYKPAPSGGQAVSANFRFNIACAAPGNISVVLDASATNTVATLLRAPWLTADGVLNVAPGAPTVGATYIVGAAPTGAWANQGHKIAQWSGTAWVFAACPVGHVVVDNTRGEGDALRYLRRTAAGWVSAMASTTVVGPTRLATPAEVLGAASGVAVSPDQLGAWATQWAAGRTFTPAAHTHDLPDHEHAVADLIGAPAGQIIRSNGALADPTWVDPEDVIKRGVVQTVVSTSSARLAMSGTATAMPPFETLQITKKYADTTLQITATPSIHLIGDAYAASTSYVEIEDQASGIKTRVCHYLFLNNGGQNVNPVQTVMVRLAGIPAGLRSIRLRLGQGQASLLQYAVNPTPADDGPAYVAGLESHYKIEEVRYV